jgi:small-conductance mechanosensitive channel
MEDTMAKTLNNPKLSRIAASVAASLLVLICALHVYWAFGGDWALSAATAGTTKTTSTGFQIFAGVIAVLALLAAIVLAALFAAAVAHGKPRLPGGAT